MVCIIRTPRGEERFYDYAELYRFILDNREVFVSTCWEAKCVGRDDETIKMKSLLLEVVPHEIIFMKNGWFKPKENGGD